MTRASDDEQPIIYAMRAVDPAEACRRQMGLRGCHAKRRITSTTRPPSVLGCGGRVERQGSYQTEYTFPGCTTGYISRIESGDRIPSLQVIRHLAAQLDVQESWLAKGLDEFAPEQELVYAELDLRLGSTEEAERRFPVTDG